jgi:hypothetical protein
VSEGCGFTTEREGREFDKEARKAGGRAEVCIQGFEAINSRKGYDIGNYWGRCLLFDYLCSKENCYSRMRIGVKLTRTVGEPGARWYGQGEIRKRTLRGVVYCFTIRKPGRQEKSNTVREK